MKKITYILLMAFICMLTLPLTKALAATISLTVDASVNNNTKVVIMSGNISSGEGQQVTLRVVNPSGDDDYLGQTSSDGSGNYRFSYMLDEEVSGVYQVMVGGTGVTTPVSTTFTFTMHTGQPAENGSPATITASVQVNNTKKEVTITGFISSGAGKKVTVKVENSAADLRYTAETTSGDNGGFQFTYLLDETASGDYTVKINGDNVSAPATLTFSYNASGNPSSPLPQGSAPLPTGGNSGTDKVATGNIAIDSDKVTTGSITIDPNNVKVNGDKTTVELTLDSLTKALDKATTLNVKIPEIQGAKEVVVKLPAEILKMAQEKSLGRITLDTGLATVAITPDALKGQVTEGAESIEISVAKVDKKALPADVALKVGDNTVYDFNIYVDGIQASKFNGKKAVEVSLNYTLKPGENPDKIVIYYINDKGKLEAIRNCEYDSATGKVSFTTNHFSQYVAMQTDVAFDDIANVTWAKTYIEALAGRGIIDGMEEGKFFPEGQLTRAQYIKLLMYAFDLVDETATTNFTDVKAGDWYYASVASAQKLGIVQGIDNNLFGADFLISRQDMATLIYRAAQVAGIAIVKTKKMQNFSDSARIAGYATDSVMTMQQAGIIDGIDNNRFAPQDNATRAQAAKIIFMVYKLK